jgi:hypothetical protein
MRVGPVEVVIDGTNFGGKTPLVARLLELLADRGWSAGSASVYREGEVHAQWDDDPVGAATTIVGRMRTHRERLAGVDVLVWDRGWPTCFISTRDAAARRLFLPLQPLTFVLLNSAAATAKKVAKYGLTPATFPWMHGQRLRDETTYEQLCRRFSDDLRSFAPTLDDDRFDLDLVAGEIVAEVAQALARRSSERR